MKKAENLPNLIHWDGRSKDIPCQCQHLFSFESLFQLKSLFLKKIELKPTGGRDDGWTEWRKESVIISERLAESAFANVAKVTPLSSETASGSAEIQKWRKWSPDVIGCQWRTVGRPISLLRFRNVHFQCRLNRLRSHDYICFSFLPRYFPLIIYTLVMAILSSFAITGGNNNQNYNKANFQQQILI
jgi:hypothetical protein